MTECPICYEALFLTSLPCKHVLCRQCLKTLLKKSKSKCPLCMTQLVDMQKLLITGDDPNAQCFVGFMFQHGVYNVKTNFETNEELAIQYYTKSAKQKNQYAQCHLGYMLSAQEKVREGIYWLKKSAEQDNLTAKALCVYNYLSHSEIKKNFAKGMIKQYHQESKDLCYYNINTGIMYWEGVIHKKSIRKAKKHFEKAIKDNMEVGNYYMGLICASEQKVKEAIEYYRKCYTIPDAFLKIGIYYYFGFNGEEYDAEDGLWYLTKAANKNIKLAQFLVGAIYEERNDRKKAKEYYQKAIANNYKPAKYNLAGMLEREEKYKEAIELYEQLDSADAQCNLGNLYLKGKGCEEDIKKAVELYKKSAEKNCQRAHFNLGLLYADGIGVKKSKTKALEHFKLSVE